MNLHMCPKSLMSMCIDKVFTAPFLNVCCVVFIMNDNNITTSTTSTTTYYYFTTNARTSLLEVRNIIGTANCQHIFWNLKLCAFPFQYIKLILHKVYLLYHLKRFNFMLNMLCIRSLSVF
jgi:hypothetical protein